MPFFFRLNFNTIFVHLPKEKKMKAIYKYDGPLGTYALEEQNGLLTRLWLGDRMACAWFAQHRHRLSGERFAVIDRLQRAKGIPSFNNQLADTRHVGELARVDFAKHAEAMGAIGINVSGIGELEDAFRRAKAADRTTVIHIDIHPTDWTEGNGSWWECGTPEVSERESVRAARKEHEAGKTRQRVGV